MSESNPSDDASLLPQNAVRAGDDHWIQDKSGRYLLTFAPADLAALRSRLYLRRCSCCSACSCLWDSVKDIHITDHPDGGSTTVPCWTSKIEYVAWHLARRPGTLLSVFRLDPSTCNIDQDKQAGISRVAYREI